MEQAVRTTEWASRRAEERGAEEYAPKAVLRSIVEALRCEHLVDREGTCSTRDRACALEKHPSTTLLRCAVCPDHELREVTEDELLVLGLR